MIDVKDLIGIPWKNNGRSKDGFDCYGLAIEVEKRFGKNLEDVFWDFKNPDLENENAPTLNVEKTNEIKPSNLVSMTLNNELHIGVILSEKEFIHATINQGVRVSLIQSYKKYINNFYKVI